MGKGGKLLELPLVIMSPNQSKYLHIVSNIDTFICASINKEQTRQRI